MSDKSQSEKPRRLRPQHHLLALGVAGLIVLVISWNRSEQTQQRAAATASPRAAVSPASSTTGGDSATEETPSSSEAVPDLRGRLLGSWADNFHGRRVFTFREDGTATMVLELDSVGKLLYGPKITFFLDWSLDDDVLSMTMTGGDPAGTAVTLAKLFGEKSQQRIEQMADAEMLLRSLDSKKLYRHERVDTPQP